MNIQSLKGILVVIALLISIKTAVSQGLNHHFLLGYTIGLDTNVTSHRAKIEFDNSNVAVIPENFPMPFRAAQANISDENGNLQFYTNGCWIADSMGNMMQNGDGLNPGLFTDDWCDQNSGIPYVYADMILPWPGDSSQYILFHQTGNYNLTNTMSSELYSTKVNMTLNGGLGGAYSKNTIVIQDTLNPGITACKHANGRDWWIVVLKDSSDIIYKLLLTPSGITNITSQHLNVPPHIGYNGQPQFSPDGTKFAYHLRYGVVNAVTHEVGLFNFDRCTGMFSNGNSMSIVDSVQGYGLSFSPNSQYLYFSSFLKIYQINTDTTDVFASLRTIANYDWYCYPDNLSCTLFWAMYLAANGKIYITSGNGVVDLNYINYPDSSGTACDVKQHSLHLPCYAARGNVNHPNYYLGPVIGSVCDSLTGLSELEIRNFKIAPNPLSDGILKISYLLPQNQSGLFEVFDLNGRIVFHQQLSPWSSLQYFNLSFLSSGIYQCVIKSGNSIATKKLMIIHR